MSALTAFRRSQISSSILIILALLLSACQRDPVITPIIGPAQAQPLLLPRQEVQWVECGSDTPANESIRCGIIQVPQDYDQPLSEQVDLYLTIFESATPDKVSDPVVYLGSGFFGGGFFGGRGTGRTIDLLTEGRDVVRFSRQQPTDEDEGSACPEIEAVNFENIQGSLSPTAVVEQTLAAYQTCRDRLEAEGLDLTAPTAAQTAKDLLALRQALGYSQFNLVGFSDSTLIALQVLQLQPDAVRSLILSRYIPPMSLADQQASFVYALQRLFAACAEDEACSSSYPDLENKFQSVLTQLDREPLQLEVIRPGSSQMLTVQMDAAAFLLFLRDLFASNDGVSRIPLIVEQVYSGEGYRLAADMQNRLMFRSFFNAEDSVAETCRDRWSSNPLAASQNASVYPVLQQALQVDYDLMTEVCSLWNQVDFAPPEVHIGTAGVPVLVLHGGFDPYFAPELVEESLRSFSESQQVVFPYQGGGIFLASDCAAGMVRDFLAEPTRQVDDACTLAGSITFQQPLY